MRYRFYKMFILLLTLLVLMIFFPFQIVFAENLPEKNVLILHSFTPEHPVHKQYNKGIESRLEQNTQYKFNLSFEYLDFARHFEEEGYFDNIAQYLRLKYKNYPPDFVVSEANLLPLLEKYDKYIFSGVPVIIAQDKDGLPAVEKHSNYFFIDQSTEAERNIQLILETRPKTKKIYIVIGDSADERIFVDQLANTEKKYANRIQFIFTNKLPYNQMIEAVEKAQDDSVILYFRWLADIEGENFIPEDVIKTICSVAKVPVYGTDSQFLGSGILGGYVREEELAGEASADTIIDILEKKGKTGPNINRTVPNIYAFDWSQLNRWKVDESKLPEGSQIEYRKTSVWQQYWGYIFGGFALIVLQTMLIFGLMINRRMRKKAENRLLKTNDSLQMLTEKLIDIDKMKDEFLTSTSHELQTPLNGIINITETLLEGNYGSMNHKQMDELRVILAVSRRLSSLIKDIIDIEKIKRNEIHFNLEVFDIRPATIMVADIFRRLIHGKSIDILIDIPMEISNVITDRNRYIQILYNLIGNAVKFTEMGTVTLSAVNEKDFVKIRVEDTGMGISKEVQSKLFHVFTQGGEEIQKQYGGSGLGLYVTQKLLEHMGGKIALEWSELGKGTCFSVTLPRSNELSVDVDNEVAISIESERSTERNDNKLTRGFIVLAVDDEPTNLRVLKSLLTGDRYEVLTALKGQEAIEIINERHDIDLVLMDVMMPGMSGYEACRKIRESYSLSDLPVLILSVRDTPEDIAAGFEAGANDFVVKPFEAKVLRARVSTQLLMKQSVQEALENEMAFLQAQIKPHFLFNALSTIMSFCYTDGERAGELLSNLSEYLQKSFSIDSTSTTVSLKNELELTVAYVEIEKARFGERLAVEFDVEEGLEEFRVLPLTIQPLVENAIRHGLMRRKSGGTVRIHAKREKEKIKITVEDNGVGIGNTGLIMNNKALLKRHSSGVGLANIKHRLRNYYGIELCIYSQIDEGTKVWFTIPNKINCMEKRFLDAEGCDC